MSQPRRPAPSNPLPQADTLRALYELAFAASGERDPSAVARLAVATARDLLRADGVSVFALDAVTGLLEPIEDTASPPFERSVVCGDGAVGRAFQSREPVVVDDYQNWDGALPGSTRRGVASALAVPLTFEHRATGAVSAWTLEPRAFTEADVRLLSLIAAQIAPALESARLTIDAEAAAGMFQALHEVAVAAGGMLETAGLAALAVERACRMAGADGAGVWIESPASGRLDNLARLDAKFANSVASSSADAVPGGVVALAFERRRPVVVEDYQEWPEAVAEVRERGVQTSFGVPLMVGDRPTGVLCVWSYTKHRVVPRDVQLLGLFAAQLAPSFESARLKEEAEARAQTFAALHELAVAAGGVLDPRSLAELAVDRARLLLRVDSAALFWWDADASLLRTLADNAAPKQRLPEAAEPVPGVGWLAFTQREAVSVGDYERFPGRVPALLGQGVRSVAAVPLLVGDRAVGTMVARSVQRDYFDDDKTKLIALIAAQVAPAVETARLAEARGADARRFRLLYDMAISASGVLEPAVLARRAVNYARELVGSDNAVLAVWSPADEALKVLAESGSRDPDEPLQAGHGVSGTAFAGRRPIAVDDYPNSEYAIAPGAPAAQQSSAAVPLIAGDRAIGVLRVGSFKGVAFSRRLQLLELLAAQVAPALVAARLHADLVGSEERFRSLYETLATGVVVQGPDGAVREANPAAEAIFGMRLAEMNGGYLTDVGQGNGDSSLEQLAVRSARSRRPVRNQVFQIVRPDGLVRWIQADAVPVLGPNGRAVQVVTSVLDITEMRRAEAALRESEGRFRAVFDSSAIGIARLDLEGAIVEPNRALCAMLGRRPADLIGRPVHEVVYRNDFPSDALTALLAEPDKELTTEFRCERRDGTLLWASAVLSLVRDDTGAPSFYIVMLEDVTARKAQEEALEHQALHDALTGLPNRSLLHDRLQQAILLGQRGEQLMALLVMDLDGFKEVNDTFGHHTGDLLLRAVATRLRNELRSSDTVARLGGDEFAIVLGGVESEHGASQAASKLLRVLEPPFRIEGGSLHVAASIGIALFPGHGAEGETLMRHADVAMYVAKRSGSGYAIYSAEADQHSPGRLTLIGELRSALERGQLELHFQPKVDVATRRVVAVEALARWRHPRRGLLVADEFVPLAERSGLIRPLGLWSLQAALRQSQAWEAQGLLLKVAVNLSVRSIQDPHLADSLGESMRDLGVPPGRLQVEITESALMANPEHAKAVLERLHAMGIELSVDDFGTGYSSLSYLRRLPVSEIKIDKSFIVDMASDPNAAVIVRSTADLAHNLGLVVVAEGVENEEAWRLAGELGCDLAQGHFLGQPQPAGRLTRQLLRSRQALHL